MRRTATQRIRGLPRLYPRRAHQGCCASKILEGGTYAWLFRPSRGFPETRLCLRSALRLQLAVFLIAYRESATGEMCCLFLPESAVPDIAVLVDLIRPNNSCRGAFAIRGPWLLRRWHSAPFVVLDGSSDKSEHVDAATNKMLRMRVLRQNNSPASLSASHCNSPLPAGGSIKMRCVSHGESIFFSSAFQTGVAFVRLFLGRRVPDLRPHAFGP